MGRVGRHRDADGDAGREDDLGHRVGHESDRDEPAALGRVGRGRGGSGDRTQPEVPPPGVEPLLVQPTGAAEGADGESGCGEGGDGVPPERGTVDGYARHRVGRDGRGSGVGHDAASSGGKPPSYQPLQYASSPDAYTTPTTRLGSHSTRSQASTAVSGPRRPTSTGTALQISSSAPVRAGRLGSRSTTGSRNHCCSAWTRSSHPSSAACSWPPAT